MDKFLIIIPKGWTLELFGKVKDPWKAFKSKYSAIAKYIEPFEERAKERQDKGDYWWELRACDYYDDFEKEKIIYPDIAKSSRFTFDNNNIYLANTAYIIPLNDFYLLGVLNSKLIYSYYKRTSTVIGDADKGGRLRWIRQDVIRIPIHVIDHNNPTDKKKHDGMVELVEAMLELNKKLAGAKTAHDKEVLQRQIDATDGQIDRLVYDLYGLTEEEIKIVEESTR
jgi:hypothetical protein